MAPAELLTFNAGAQVLVSSVLGFGMLVPMQSWGRALRAKLDMKALLSAHLDWLMLAFMQWGAVLVMRAFHVGTPLIAWLLVFGGWTNATPYLFRGFGINAFVLGGNAKQFLAASLAGISSLAIVVAWALLLAQAWSRA